MPKPPLKTVSLVVVVGVAMMVVGLFASVELALLGLLFLVAAPLLLLAPTLRQPPDRRYDAIGDDIAALLGRVGTASHPRRPRDPDRDR